MIKADKDVIVNVSLHDSKTCEIFRSFRAICREDEGFFDAVDMLTREIKSVLTIPNELLSRDIDEEISQIVTGSPEACILYSQGMQLLRQGKGDEGKLLLERAVGVDSKFAEAFYQLFLAVYGAYLRSGDTETKNDAIRNGEKAFECINRLNAWTRISFIGEYCLDFQKNYLMAIAEYGKLLTIRTDNPVVVLQLGQIYTDLEEYDRVIQLLENESVQQDPRNLQVLANAYVWTGAYDKAEILLDDYLTKNSSVFIRFWFSVLDDLPRIRLGIAASLREKMIFPASGRSQEQENCREMGPPATSALRRT